MSYSDKTFWCILLLGLLHDAILILNLCMFGKHVLPCNHNHACQHLHA